MIRGGHIATYVSSPAWVVCGREDIVDYFGRTWLESRKTARIFILMPSCMRPVLSGPSKLAGVANLAREPGKGVRWLWPAPRQ